MFRSVRFLSLIFAVFFWAGCSSQPASSTTSSSTAANSSAAVSSSASVSQNSSLAQNSSAVSSQASQSGTSSAGVPTGGIYYLKQYSTGLIVYEAKAGAADGMIFTNTDFDHNPGTGVFRFITTNKDLYYWSAGNNWYRAVPGSGNDVLFLTNSDFDYSPSGFYPEYQWINGHIWYTTNNTFTFFECVPGSNNDVLKFAPSDFDTTPTHSYFIVLNNNLLYGGTDGWYRVVAGAANDVKEVSFSDCEYKNAFSANYGLENTVLYTTNLSIWSGGFDVFMVQSGTDSLYIGESDFDGPADLTSYSLLTESR